MADTVRKVEYFSIVVSNKPGQAFGVLSALVSSGINLLACRGTERARRARIEVVPDDTRKFRNVVKKAGLRFTAQKTGFLIQGDDRPGALAEHLRTLADREVNVAGIDSVSTGEGRWGAIIWVENEAVRKAERALKARAAPAARVGRRAKGRAAPPAKVEPRAKVRAAPSAKVRRRAKSRAAPKRRRATPPARRASPRR